MATSKFQTDTTGIIVARFSKRSNAKIKGFIKGLESLLSEARHINKDDRIVLGDLSYSDSKNRCNTCGSIIASRLGICHNCQANRKRIWRLISYALPQWKLISLSLTILLVATSIGMTPPLLMRMLIDDVLRSVSTDPRCSISYAETTDMDCLSVFIG